MVLLSRFGGICNTPERSQSAFRCLMEELLEQDPLRYETLANLGTFHVHAGDLEEGDGEYRPDTVDSDDDTSVSMDDIEIESVWGHEQFEAEMATLFQTPCSPPVSTSTPTKGKNIKSAIGEYFETHSELAKEENYEKTETEDGIVSSTIGVHNNVIKLNREDRPYPSYGLPSSPQRCSRYNLGSWELC
mgnify:CR=1 FL=1